MVLLVPSQGTLMVIFWSCNCSCHGYAFAYLISESYMHVYVPLFLSEMFLTMLICSVYVCMYVCMCAQICCWCLLFYRTSLPLSWNSSFILVILCSKRRALQPTTGRDRDSWLSKGVSSAWITWTIDLNYKWRNHHKSVHNCFEFTMEGTKKNWLSLVKLFSSESAPG
jgi:hypothetical protein